MRSYRVVDLSFTWNGDLVLDARGDLADTSRLVTGSFRQECYTRLYGDLQDWALHPHLGASLSELNGEPNERKTAEDGRARIISSLTKDGFCDAHLIKVRYLPLDQHTLYYDVIITLPGAPSNETIRFSLIFGLSEDGNSLVII